MKSEQSMQVGFNWDLGLASKVFQVRASCLQLRRPHTTFAASRRFTWEGFALVG